MPTSQKLSIIEKISSKPVREAERITLSLSTNPKKARPDRIQTLSEKHIEMKFTASCELQQKLKYSRAGLLINTQIFHLENFFEKLCDLGLSEWSPSKIATPRKRRVNLNVPSVKLTDKGKVSTNLSQKKITQILFQRAQSKCEN